MGQASEPVQAGGQYAEAARMLRAVIAALPPRTSVDRATARRIEGAATVIDLVRKRALSRQLKDLAGRRGHEPEASSQ
jgi:hypothetical protein